MPAGFTDLVYNVCTCCCHVLFSLACRPLFLIPAVCLSNFNCFCRGIFAIHWLAHFSVCISNVSPVPIKYRFDARLCRLRLCPLVLAYFRESSLFSLLGMGMSRIAYITALLSSVHSSLPRPRATAIHPAYIYSIYGGLYQCICSVYSGHCALWPHLWCCCLCVIAVTRVIVLRDPYRAFSSGSFIIVICVTPTLSKFFGVPSAMSG